MICVVGEAERHADDDEMSKSKLEVVFQYGDSLTSETESSNISAVDRWIEVSDHNLVCQYISTFLSELRH